MKAEKGDTVKVEYEGKLENGEIFDSTEKHNSEPLEFKIGAGQMIPGFDKAVEGMSVGETKTITLKPSEAYGDMKDYLIRDIPGESLPKNMKFEKGIMIGMTMPNGINLEAKVVAVNKKSIKVDMNHPLAGKTLTFKVKLVEVSS
ncbi:MAG: peptidylprolyl isomerase [Candidatus Aenigmarchaeota archaeon]|nr:peptidylprolyl isomerase [Candidatus Aenigmarchaeota archaeon]